MTRAVLTLFLPILVIGCAATPPPSPIDPSIKRPDFLAPFGLARVTGHSDVVTVPDSVEHVLYPNNSSVRRPAHPAATEKPVAQFNTSSVIDDISIQTTELPITSIEVPDPSTDEIRLAWQKFCKLDMSITGREWLIVESNAIPADISATWDLHCRPAQQH